jgi:magnesium-transporting ATPase (P-type)
MNTQKFLVSGIIGGIVSFFAGYLIYGIALMDFFAKNGGAATGVMRPQDQMIWWSLILGSLFHGLVFSYIYNRWANINTLGAGATAGAVLGLLIMASHDFIMYATADITNLTGVIVDIIAASVMGAIVGAAVGMANGMGSKKAA